ncbi:Division abnormally delayed protein [Papilio xuthus]|uniref:Division abnormally delayed protein n=1 Tax=Papilio xuthus TaxID=66420 RepID=A0A194PLC3_PAPXU|nr:Division abnormally delayed protein [Papilio xuthus]
MVEAISLERPQRDANTGVWRCLSESCGTCILHTNRVDIWPVCGGQCCGRRRETELKVSLKRMMEDRAISATRPIAELLLATRRTLQEHLTALSHQSQNKTSVLFLQLYRVHASRAKGPLSALYDDIRILLRSEERETNVDIISSPPKDLAASTRKFFRDVFPVAYQNILKLDAKQFTPEYEACLQDAYDAVKPFGEVPQQLGSSLSRSMEAARVLLQVLAVGASALTASEQLLVTSNEECHNKMLVAAGCAHCKGFDVSPCQHYCLNIARGCIGSLVSELEAPWAGYVEGVERVARADADAALRALDARVSEAIMHALENHAVLEKKCCRVAGAGTGVRYFRTNTDLALIIFAFPTPWTPLPAPRSRLANKSHHLPLVRQECGSPTTLDVSGLTAPTPTPGAARRDALRAPPPDTELLQFAATLAASKKLFSGLADKLCDEPEFANEGNTECWNGETVGEYTKPLVASASNSDQKYNPEITSGVKQDLRVAALGDKLRQARQLLVSHSWGAAPAAEAFMQGDEAGDEGSGSGRSYTDDDAAYDAEGSGEEGSGAQDVGSKTFVREENTYSSTEKTSAGTRSRPLLALTFVVAISRITSCFF